MCNTPLISAADNMQHASNEFDALAVLMPEESLRENAKDLVKTSKGTPETAEQLYHVIAEKTIEHVLRVHTTIQHISTQYVDGIPFENFLQSLGLEKEQAIFSDCRQTVATLLQNPDEKLSGKFELRGESPGDSIAFRALQGTLHEVKSLCPIVEHLAKACRSTSNESDKLTDHETRLLAGAKSLLEIGDALTGFYLSWLKYDLRGFAIVAQIVPQANAFTYAHEASDQLRLNTPQEQKPSEQLAYAAQCLELLCAELQAFAIVAEKIDNIYVKTVRDQRFYCFFQCAAAIANDMLTQNSEELAEIIEYHQQKEASAAQNKSGEESSSESAEEKYVLIRLHAYSPSNETVTFIEDILNSID